VTVYFFKFYYTCPNKSVLAEITFLYKESQMQILHQFFFRIKKYCSKTVQISS